jgi:hypothetical protein
VVNQLETQMTNEQAQIVRQVYDRFNDGENDNVLWTEIDETLWQLSWLDGDQLIREASVLFSHYKGRQVKCNMVHVQSECFAPKIVGAVEAILESHGRAGKMLSEHKYILQYFLTLSQLGVISTKT